MQFFKTLSAFVTLGVALVGSGVSATPLGASSVIARDEAVDLQNPYRIIFIKGPLGRRDLEAPGLDENEVEGTDLFDREESDAKVDLQAPGPYRIIFIKGT